jgi:signal transduction histidine kinase
MKSIRIVSLLFIYLGLLTIISIILTPKNQYFIGTSTESSAKNSLRSIALVESDYFAESGKYFLTIEGNQTKNINNNLFSGKKVLNEDGYYGFYILSEGDSGFKACTIPSSFGQTRMLANYCLNQEGQLWKLPKIVSRSDYQLEVPILSTLDEKTTAQSYASSPPPIFETTGFVGDSRNPFTPFSLLLDSSQFEEDSNTNQNQNQVLNIIYVTGIGIVFILVFILIENYLPYRRWLGFSHFYRSHSISKLTIFSRWVVVALVIILFFAILIKLALSIVTTGLPEFLFLYLLWIDELLGIQDFFNSHGIYLNTASQIKSVQYLFAIPAIFSLIAIAIILHSKKKLLIYATKLAKGDNVEPPKIRLQEFSDIVNAIDTLQHKLKGKKYIETFINSISHEVRIPLAGIKANTESLNLKMDDVDFTQSKNNIIESNDRMLLIIDSLLELAKLEQQNKSLEKTKFDINNTIEKIINETETVTRLKDKNINISFNEHNKNIITCNEILIEMCLLNIVNNAIDFSLKDSNIYINVTDNNKNLSIKILDEGVGIPDNLLDKIQDKFVSTSRPYTKKRSTGLGLNLVKIIMELHDGIFEINNRQDAKGVVVKLTFSK